MSSTRNPGRVAGLWYLLLVLSGPIRLIYIPNMLFVHLRDHQTTAAEILWGLWLFPLAILTYRSRFLPRFLGVWLVINGFAYVILSLTGELLPQYQDKVFALSQPALFAEVALMLWLVIKGAKPPPPAAAALSSPAA